ncbi:MAG: motility protein A [Candidatus Kapaibacterium sp.]
MKASTLTGIIAGIIAIFGAFLWEGGTLDTLFMLPAMTIVIGGTLAAGLAGTSFRQMSKIPALFRVAVSPKKYDIETIIKQIVEYSTYARREGILSLESRLDKLKHPYLKKLFEICIDGADPQVLQNIAHNEMHHLEERHNSNIGLFEKLGGYSPTFGIIGTVMGLISVLASAGSDPEVLIHHIASAFIATMWGILLANILWLPLADKLRTLHDSEMQLMEVMLEGVYAVQLGETPTVIRSRLISALPLYRQREILRNQKARFQTLKTNESPSSGNGSKTPAEESEEAKQGG